MNRLIPFLGGLSRPPLPASATEYWHCKYGLGLASATKIQSWTGQIRGAVVQAPSVALRPDYVVDSGYYNNQPTISFSGGKTLWSVAAASPPFSAIGTRPYCYVVARFRAPASGAVQMLITTFNNLPGSATDYAAGTLQNQPTGDGMCTFWYPMGSVFESPASPTQNASKHFEFYLNTAGRLAIKIDNIESVGTATNQFTLAPCESVQFGADRGTQASDTSLAFVLLASSVPTAAEIAALHTWAAVSFNV